MSQRASDWESIRQGPGKRSCKRSLDQTSGSSSSNQNSSALSDWLPGATVQTLAETYVSYIIAVLSCLSQRGSSQGIDEPADLECRGVPAFVASCWAQESPKLSITRSADWRAKPWVAARHGTTATFLEIVQLLQLHLPVPSQEPLLWSFSSRPWFAVALLGLIICRVGCVTTLSLLPRNFRASFFSGDTSRDIKTNIHRLIHTDILKTPVLAKVH